MSFKIIFLIQKWGRYEHFTQEVKCFHRQVVGKETSLTVEGTGGRKNGENGLLRLWLNLPPLFRFQIIQTRIILLEGLLNLNLP